LYVQTRQTEFAQRLFFLTDSQRLKAGDQLQEANDLLLSHAMDLKAREAGITSVALNCLLFSKSLNLSTAQKIRQNIQKDTALAPLFSAWTDVREQLAWSYSQPRSVLESQKIDIPALEAHSDQLEKRLASESKDFAFESLHKTFTWTDIRDRLRPGEAAMEIAYFHEFHLLEQSDTTRYAVFLVRPEMREEPAVFFLPDGSYIDQIQIEKYLSECITPDGKGKTGDLYDAFWGKLTPYLQGVSRLYISADGSFLKINFSAIQLPSGKYVADQYEVRNVFSLKDILTNDQDPGETRKTGKTAFLAGNPAFSLNPEGNTAMAGMRSVSETYDTLTSLNPFVAVLREVNETRGVTLTPLPGSEQEVNDLAIILRKHRWETTVVTGISAKEETIKALNKPSVLHLATHGYFLVNLRSGTAGLSRPILESNPMFRSMVFLAGAQNALDRKPVGGEDGILTAYEAQNLQLDGTELVVLSACKTGQGKIQNGEGVYGLQRALHIAGAKAVLLSLWDVDDKVGREFMVLFYEKWLGGMMKTEAFRATQMEIRKKHPLPFYWAGFILMD
jgi:CHAT domain-containing protein